MEEQLVQRVPELRLERALRGREHHAAVAELSPSAPRAFLSQVLHELDHKGRKQFAFLKLSLGLLLFPARGGLTLLAPPEGSVLAPPRTARQEEVLDMEVDQFVEVECSHVLMDH